MDFDMSASKSSGAEDFQWAVRLIRYVLELYALWPTEVRSAGKRFLINLYRLALLVIIIVGILIPTLRVLAMNINDLMSVMDNLKFSVPLVMCSVKIMIFWSKQKDLLEIVNAIAEDWTKSKTDKERDVMIERARIARLITLFEYVSIFLTFILIVMLPAFGISLNIAVSSNNVSTASLPVDTIYYFDVDKSPTYEIMYVAQICIIFIGGSCYIGVNNFLGLAVFHFCGQLENLRNRITDMYKSPDFDTAFAFNVNDHTRIIRSVKQIESAFRVLLLGWLIYFGLFLCIYGILIVSLQNQKDHDVSNVQLFTLVCTLFSIFLNVCLHCVIGEILVAQSEGIYSVVYHYNWEDLEPKKAKMFILLLARTKTPLYITAGKMFPMTMPMFCSLIKCSAGYVSVLVTAVH